MERFNKMKTTFFCCADINKKKMRKIIITDDTKKQKKMLLKSLHIFFNEDKELDRSQYKTKLPVINFLPQDLNRKEIFVKKHNKEEELFSQDSEYILTILKLKKQKMIKIIGDFFYNILVFCISTNLSLIEISTFLSINKYIFLKLINTCPHIIPLFWEYKRIMLQHSIDRYPYFIEVFSFQSLKVLIKYSLNTLFKHFLFYKYIFTPDYKIYFQCIDTNNSYDKRCIESCFANEEFKINDDIITFPIKWEEHGDYIRDLIKLNVGCVVKSVNEKKGNEKGNEKENENEENEKKIMKELNDYFGTFPIKNDSAVFELNQYENSNTVDQMIKRIKIKKELKTSTDLSDENQKNSEAKIGGKNEEQLIERVNILYEDLENRIMSCLKQFLDSTK